MFNYLWDLNYQEEKKSTDRYENQRQACTHCPLNVSPHFASALHGLWLDSLWEARGKKKKKIILFTFVKSKLHGVCIMWVESWVQQIWQIECQLGVVCDLKRRERFASAGFHLRETTSEVSHLFKMDLERSQLAWYQLEGQRRLLKDRLRSVHKRTGTW